MSEWNDKALKDLLKALPKIEDHRDPREIYQNVTMKMNKKKQKSWLLPSLASAAALLLFVFLVPNLMEWRDFADNFANKAELNESGESIEMTEQKAKETRPIAKEDSKNELNAHNEAEVKTQFDTYDHAVYSAIYATEVSGHSLFIYPIPDQRGQIIVPVTVLAPTDQTKFEFQQYEELMPLLTEEEWGLAEYYPLNAKLTISEDKKTLNIDLPADHLYGEGSTAEDNFIRVVNDAAAVNGIKTITFSTEGKPGVMFAHTGYIEIMPIRKYQNRGYYFYNISEGAEKPYLVPSTDSFSSIKEALNAMKEGNEINNLQESIPSGFIIAEVIEDEDLLVIRLDDSATLSNNESMLYTIEAILLTAKEFNFERVKVENSNLKQIGKFVFNEEWTVPLAPNKRIISK